MKLQISYDFADLDKALQVAQATAQYADILEVGALLLYRYGIQAAYEFKKEFPNNKLLVDAKLVDRVDDVVPLLCKSAADYITILAGTNNHIIKKAARLAHEHETEVMLDLIDAYSPGETAKNAKALGVDALLFHKGHDAPDTAEALVDYWQQVDESTDLPIFISGRIDDENIGEILSLHPEGIVVGTFITRSSDPGATAAAIKQRMQG